jgi:hypothetical protein
MMPLSYLSRKTEVRETIMGGSAGKPGRCFASVTAPKTMLTIAEGANIRRASRCQRVEDNAFHLGYFAR